MAEIFRHPHRVSYSECTLGNHVYYGRYLDLLEEVRGAFFRELGQPFLRWQEQETIFPVVECHLRYRQPARYDDLLVLEVWIETLDRARLGFAYRILRNENQVVLTGSTLHLCTSIADKPKRLPEELVRALRPYWHEKGKET